MISLTNFYFSRANTARIFRVSKKHIVGRAITRNFSYTCRTINAKNKRTNLLSRIVGSHIIVRGGKSSNFEECVARLGIEACQKQAKTLMGEYSAGVLPKSIAEKQKDFSTGVQESARKIQEETGDKPYNVYRAMYQNNNANGRFIDRAKMAQDQKRFTCSVPQYDKLTEELNKTVVKINDPEKPGIHGKFALQNEDGSLNLFTKCKKWFDPIKKVFIWTDHASAVPIKSTCGLDAKGMGMQQTVEIDPKTLTTPLSEIEKTTLDLDALALASKVIDYRKTDPETCSQVLDPELKSMHSAKVQRDLRTPLSEEALTVSEWFTKEKLKEEAEKQQLKTEKMGKEDKNKKQ